MSPFFTLVFFLSFCLIPLASAQFQFFDQMFGHPQQQRQQQQHRPGTSQWVVQSENTECSQYLCPTTLVCVANPAECPCPSVEDIKCTIPDGYDDDASTVVCVRGADACAGVEKLMQLK